MFQVKKRDGQLVEFDMTKITTATLLNGEISLGILQHQYTINTMTMMMLQQKPNTIDYKLKFKTKIKNLNLN